MNEDNEPIQEIINLINSEVPVPAVRTALKPLEQRPVENSSAKLLDYKTLMFKPWSGKSPENDHEYQIKQENLPEEQIKQELEEEDSVSELKQSKFKIKSPIEHIVSQNQRGYYYKFQSGHVKLIKYLLEQNGFTQCPQNSNNWTIYWSCTPIKMEVYMSLLPYQKVNHFPNSFQITRKDLMNKNISKMQIKYGYNNFNFLPKTFILPQQIDQLQQEYRKNKRIYICKPHNRSQGKGIIVTDDIDIITSRLDKYASLVVSQYVDNPLLINGFKFDLRIYVGISSIYPLRLYIHEQGLARFATQQYSNQMSTQKKNFRHLTNYSVNKKNQNFVPSSTGQDDYYGSKWSLTALRDFLEFNVGRSETAQLFQKIDDLVIKTILSIQNLLYSNLENNVPYINNCFQVLGFDVLIDSTLKPWLVEVNHSPSMNTDSPLDLKIKGGVIAEMFTLIGIVPQSARYMNNNHMRNITEKYTNGKHNYSLNRGQVTAMDKYVLKETELEQSRCGRWRKVYPLPNCFKYKNFFETQRHFNSVLRQSFYKKNTTSQKSVVSTSYSTISRRSNSKNVRISKKQDLKYLRKI